MAEESQLPPGTPQSLKRYRLVHLLGSGAIGSVFAAHDDATGSRVALKLVHPHIAAAPGFSARFERLAREAMLLRSPHIVRVLDSGTDQGIPFLASEFVAGESVAAALARGPLAPARALGIAAGAARALQEAAERGLVHGDLKPDNILLASDGAVKVGDFGFARLAPGFGAPSAYAAPARAGDEPDIRDDIYALGGTLFCMLTGRPPFAGPREDVLRQHREAPVPLGPLASLPPPVARVVQRCMERERAARIQTPAALVTALAAAAEGRAEQPPSAPLAPVEAALGSSGPDLGPPPPAAGSPGAALAGAPQLWLQGSRREGIIGGRASTAFELLLSNPGDYGADYVLSAFSPSGNIRFNLPPRVAVPAGGSAPVRLRARPERRRWFGPTTIEPFTVSAAGGAGPPAIVVAELRDQPFGWAPFAMALALLAGIAGLVALLLLLGGGGGDATAGGASAGPGAVDTLAAIRDLTATARAAGGNSPSALPTASATPAFSPSVPPGGSATAPASPRPGGTLTPVAGAPPDRSAASGRWNYSLIVTDSTCDFSPFVGDTFRIGLDLSETGATRDGYITAGETVRVTDTISGNVLGVFTFAYPVFAFRAPLLDGDFVYLEITYSDALSSTAYREDHYLDGCVIFYEEQ